MKIKRPVSKQPIPAYAKRVFRGKIFDVYQWQQELFDGTKSTFEKIKRRDTVNVFPVTKEGKIILTEQVQPAQKSPKPFIGCLGGRIDEGETPLQTAKRELLEEAGYEAKKFILWDSTQPLGKIDWAIYSFIAKELKRTISYNPDAGEKIKLKVVTFDEFLKIVTQDNYRDLEITLKLLKAKEKPKELRKIRRLFEK